MQIEASPVFAPLAFRHPRLGALVSAPWTMSYPNAVATLPGLIAPDAHVEFVFQLGTPCGVRANRSSSGKLPAAMLYAQRHGMLALEPRGANAMIAFRTTPAVATVILGRPLDDCWDRPIDLADLIGRDTDRLVARLAEAEAAERPERIEAWLIGRLSRWDADHERSQRLQRALLWRSGGRPVGALADAFGLSERTLRRMCARDAGLSPKQLSMSGRILRACADLVDRRSLPLAEVALRSGFGDQAAFTNAFRHYVGTTPGRLRAEPIVYCERPAA
jgi:AraC-like DNA-binding protein